MADFIQIKLCRICHSPKLIEFFSLGVMPPPNLFPKNHPRNLKRESFYPLDVCLCQNCGLVQLKHTVNPNIMFKDYIYVTSGSKTMVNHFEGLAKDIMGRIKTSSEPLIVDIGSNDGTLLEQFLKYKVKALGVDPAKNLAKLAKSKGIETIASYFNQITSQKIKSKFGKAKVITATNVLAHVGNLHDFLEAVENLLDTDGIFVAEFPYLIDLLDKNAIDTIYHEHLSYFSIKPLLLLFGMHNLEIFDVERLNVHGGSIRLLVSHRQKTDKHNGVNKLLKLEESFGLNKPETYHNFAKKAYSKRQKLTNFLNSLKSKNCRIVGYGAAAKGNVLLNFTNIGKETIEYIVDSTPQKQGRLTPGTHIPIFPEAKLLEDMPDYTLILAWNFADEILKKNSQYRKQGGKFILTVPDIKIV